MGLGNDPNVTWLVETGLPRAHSTTMLFSVPQNNAAKGSGMTGKIGLRLGSGVGAGGLWGQL